MNSDRVWEILDEIKDPEIPVVSLIEMGMVLGVSVVEDRVRVELAPTFVACPAIEMMRAEIETRLMEAGATEVRVDLSLSPPWSTDWITPTGREKLKAFGLAPPPFHCGRIGLAEVKEVPCPYCASTNTQLKNSFGPTLCRAIFYCNNCQQPFEGFKSL